MSWLVTEMNWWGTNGGANGRIDWCTANWFDNEDENEEEDDDDDDDDDDSDTVDTNDSCTDDAEYPKDPMK